MRRTQASVNLVAAAAATLGAPGAGGSARRTCGRSGLIVLLAGLGSAFPLASAAQQGDAVQAPYTAQQVQTGATVYGTVCASCHLPNLQGSFEAPELAGPGFPITYEVDGVEYVAVTAGQGGGSPWRIPSFLTPELISPEEGHNAVYVFRVNRP